MSRGGCTAPAPGRWCRPGRWRASPAAHALLVGLHVGLGLRVSLAQAHALARVCRLRVVPVPLVVVLVVVPRVALVVASVVAGSRVLCVRARVLFSYSHLYMGAGASLAEV